MIFMLEMYKNIPSNEKTANVISESIHPFVLDIKSIVVPNFWKLIFRKCVSEFVWRLGMSISCDLQVYLCGCVS